LTVVIAFQMIGSDTAYLLALRYVSQFSLGLLGRAINDWRRILICLRNSLRQLRHLRCNPPRPLKLAYCCFFFGAGTLGVGRIA